MSSITDIKRRIIELGPAEFQEFCDTFLSKKGCGNVHGYGMKAGTGKLQKAILIHIFEKRMESMHL